MTVATAIDESAWRPADHAAEWKCRPRHTIRELAREIGGDALLTEEEEVALGRAIRSPETSERDRAEAVRTLTGKNIRLVISVARGLALAREDLGELVSDGTIGLIRAAEKYDPDMGVMFATYASYWIKQSIHRGRRRAAYGKPWRIADHLATKRLKAENFRARLASDGIDISIEEAGRRAGLKERDVEKLARTEVGVSQESFGANDCRNLIDEATSPQEAAEDEERRRLVLGLINRLGGKERAVVRLYYGLDDLPGVVRPDGTRVKLPGALVADRLGISRERVRQIRTNALKKLRRWAAEGE